jgi:hypothetical protein
VDAGKGEGAKEVVCDKVEAEPAFATWRAGSEKFVIIQNSAQLRIALDKVRVR